LSLPAIDPFFLTRDGHIIPSDCLIGNSVASSAGLQEQESRLSDALLRHAANPLKNDPAACVEYIAPFSVDKTAKLQGSDGRVLLAVSACEFEAGKSLVG
jgi:hypothetical protein